MKRIVFGLILGAGLMFGMNVSAEVVNYVGKVIEGQFPVKVDGQTIEAPGIVVDGTSYLPVRTIGELLGYDVAFDADMGVEMKRKAGQPVQNPGETPLSQSVEYKRYQQAHKELVELLNVQQQLRDEISSKKTPENYLDPISPEDQRKLDEIQTRIDALASEKTQLETWINEQLKAQGLSQ